ncbi:hypothetical protein PTKU46_79510 [Paraburkholderia terrae]
MITPHEFATLMLVQNKSDQEQLDAADLEALILDDLVALDKSPDRQRAHVTCRGASVLKVVSCIDRNGIIW